MKIIQYANLGISGRLEKQKDKEDIAKKILRLSQTARDARIAFSNLNLYPTLNSLICLYNTPKSAVLFPLERTLQYGKLISQLGSTTFDNATLLARNEVLNPKKEKCYDKTMSYFWTINILFAMSLSYLKAKQVKKVDDPKKTKEKDDTSGLQKKIYYVDMVSNFGDIFAALAGTDLLPKYFGFNFDKTVRGFGGCLAASTGIWEYKLNQKLNKKI